MEKKEDLQDKSKTDDFQDGANPSPFDKNIKNARFLR